MAYKLSPPQQSGELDELDKRLILAMERMITAAIQMVSTADNIAVAAKSAVVHFYRFDPVARQWRQRRDWQRAQAYLNTRRTTRRD